MASRENLSGSSGQVCPGMLHPIWRARAEHGPPPDRIHSINKYQSTLISRSSGNGLLIKLHPNRGDTNHGTGPESSIGSVAGSRSIKSRITEPSLSAIRLNGDFPASRQIDLPLIRYADQGGQTLSRRQVKAPHADPVSIDGTNSATLHQNGFAGQEAEAQPSEQNAISEEPAFLEKGETVPDILFG